MNLQQYLQYLYSALDVCRNEYIANIESVRRGNVPPKLHDSAINQGIRWFGKIYTEIEAVEKQLHQEKQHTFFTLAANE